MLSALILSRHSYPTLRVYTQLEYQRSVIPGPLVLRNALVKCPAPAVDKDQTVLRRFEPSSRTSLTGEQPDPWDLLQPQDVMSRHRGAKAGPSDPAMECGIVVAQRIKGTLGITG